MKFSLRPFAVSVVMLVCPWLCSSGQPGGSDQPTAARPGPPVDRVVVIPGPLRSFMRMAAISQKAPADEVLPLLARNVYVQGYQQGTATEYLILLDRYVQQARELQILAGSSHTIRVRKCDDAGTVIPFLGVR